MHGFLKVATSALVIALGQQAAAEEHETSAGTVEVTQIIGGLETPWAIAFLPGNGILVTERGGRLNLITDGTARRVEGVPEVWTQGQGGLLDVMVPRDFDTTGEIFLTYAEAAGGGTGNTALAVARLDTAAAVLDDVRVIFRQAGPTSAGQHFGSRAVEAADGTVFLTIGDRGDRDAAQDLGTHNGKVVRVARDGSVPSDNPFTERDGALPEIWSFGHRNAQGAALAPDGTLWLVEHGPQGGDELNVAVEGGNYGWPVQSFGDEYGTRTPVGTRGPIGDIAMPEWYWDVSPAVSGLVVYSGALFPEWRDSLLTGALQHDTIIRLSGGADGVSEAERLFEGAYPRIRDVREAPDGSVWFLSEGDGAVYRVTPAPGS